jgi:hypothetical protein
MLDAPRQRGTGRGTSRRPACHAALTPGARRGYSEAMVRGVAWRGAMVVVAVTTGGCLHIQTELPGVLDLRSDATEAPIQVAPPPPGDAVAREGLERFALGAGVVGTTDITIEDRTHYALAFFPLFNDHGTQEWAAAQGEGALRNVVLGEELSVWNFFVNVLKTACTCGLGGIIGTSWDVKGKATRVRAELAPRGAPVVPLERLDAPPLSPAPPTDDGANAPDAALGPDVPADPTAIEEDDDGAPY